MNQSQLTTDSIDTGKVKADMDNALVVYNRMAVQLMTLLVVLGVIAIFCSLFVTSFAGSSWFSTDAVKITSFASTLSLTLITAFSIATKGNSARSAWRHLNKALLLYRSGNSSVVDLIKAYEEAEAILGGVDFAYQIPTKDR